MIKVRNITSSFFELEKDAPEVFEAPKQALGFVSTLVHFSTIFAWARAVTFRCNDGNGLPDFFGLFQSRRTTSIASVKQYCRLNSLGVR